jgi:hypothetical protein
MAAAARTPSETITNISGITELDTIYSLLAARLEGFVRSIDTDRDHRFSHMIPILLGGYALYKYYPQELLNHPILKTEDIDFKFILNSNDEAEYAAFKETLRIGFETSGIFLKENNIYYFFENRPKYRIDVKFDYKPSPLYFNYESRFLDVSIIKEYNSLNLFLEFNQLFPHSRSISNIPFEVLKPSVLSENDAPYYFFGSEEFLDFNTIHLYIFVDTLIRSRIVNPRLIKTSKLMSRLMLLLSKGYNSGNGLTMTEYTLFNSLESLLSEFNRFYMQFPEQSQPSVILETLSSLINSFSPIITTIESNIGQNTEVLTVCNFLMSKLQDLNIPGLSQHQNTPTSVDLSHTEELSHNYESFFQEPYQYPVYQEEYNPELFYNPDLFYYHPPPPYYHFQPQMGAEGSTRGRGTSRGRGSGRDKGKGRKGGYQSGGAPQINIDYLINLLGKDLVHLDLDKVDEKEKLKRYREAWLFIEFNNKLFELIKKMNMEINKKLITVKKPLTKTGLELSGHNNPKLVLVKASGGSKRKNVKSKKLRKTIIKRNINRNIKKTTNHKKTKKHNRRKISIKKQKGGYEYLSVDMINIENVDNDYKIMKYDEFNGMSRIPNYKYFIVPINKDMFKDFHLESIKITDEVKYDIVALDELNGILEDKDKQLDLKRIFDNKMETSQNIGEMIEYIYGIQDKPEEYVKEKKEHRRTLARHLVRYDRAERFQSLIAKREHERERALKNQSELHVL